MASVTDWLNKYQEDTFLRTEINIIALQLIFALIILTIVTVSFFVVDHKVADDIARVEQATVVTADEAVSVFDEIRNLRAQRLAATVATIVVTTILFGYVMARITLTPARNSFSVQKQFIGNVAHELRTPLSIIKTNNEIALLEPKITHDLRETIESNIEELDRISDIINNLLSVSALIRPEHMEFNSIDLAAVVSSTVDKLAPLAHRSEINVTIRKSTDSHVWGNLAALQQIVNNLVKNAITYTPRHGLVELTIGETASGMVELVVRDTGIGIARKDLFHIFEPFYRADPSRARSHSGSGLGLTIVSELVKIHHGKISVQSAVGTGTKVTVLLPVATGHDKSTSERHSDKLSEIAVDYSHGS